MKTLVLREITGISLRQEPMQGVHSQEERKNRELACTAPDVGDVLRGGHRSGKALHDATLAWKASAIA